LINEKEIIKKLNMLAIMNLNKLTKQLGLSRY